MFPISHAYVASQLTKRTSPLLIFGSVLPDISTTSENRIRRDYIHDNPSGFSQFVGRKYPLLADLATGVRLHSGVNKGADYYSDDNEMGFAKIEGKNLIDDVIRVFDIQDKTMALNLAHNFIEAAVDLHLLRSDPDLIKLYSEAMKVKNSELSLCLSEYLDISEDQITNELDIFRRILGSSNLLNEQAMIEGIFSPLIGMRFLIHADENVMLLLLQKALKQTEGKALGFLREAIEGMRIDFEKQID